MVLRRLDAELTRRGLARSRDQARDLITSGFVQVRGTVALKPATQVDGDVSIVVNDEDDGAHYVSRGAHKLLGALEVFTDFDISGRDGLDAGASTGGFTQVLLERGIARVLAVDVGYGQLAWPLRGDPRVHLMERTNVRTLSADALPWLASVVVADLSFISLKVVLPALVSCSTPTADYLLMVKPQFEVGRAAVGEGVVRDPQLRVDAVSSVTVAAAALGLHVRGVTASPLPGPAGNVEYFLWLQHGDPDQRDNRDNDLSAAALAAAIRTAVEEGPV
ncbi:MAG: TlyA family RNA methyltransferase [Actinomycetota bacterium]|nr:TlyA family RNA methyltransferase [Actinomycetota bacterium]